MKQHNLITLAFLSITTCLGIVVYCNQKRKMTELEQRITDVEKVKENLYNDVIDAMMEQHKIFVDELTKKELEEASDNQVRLYGKVKESNKITIDDNGNVKNFVEEAKKNTPVATGVADEVYEEITNLTATDTKGQRWAINSSNDLKKIDEPVILAKNEEIKSSKYPFF